MIIKNIIFDFNGVLFEYDYSSYRNLEPNIKTIKEGIDLLSKIITFNKSLNNRSFKLFGCTNWSSKVINFLKIEFPEVIGLFDAIVTPDYAGAKKPDHKIFEFLTTKYNIVPEQCLFIDDCNQNVESAKNFGMHSICLLDFEKLIKNLEDLDII